MQALSVWLTYYGIAILALVFIVGCGPSDEDCLKDLDCAAKAEWRLEAEDACGPGIEAHARYGARWTDGFFGSKFPYVFLQRPEYETLRYTGDKIEFQNAFGAWSQMYYACVYDPVKKQAASIEVW